MHESVCETETGKEGVIVSHEVKKWIMSDVFAFVTALKH